MTSEDFKHSLTLDSPPAAFTVPLRALWWDARGDWHQAHAEVDSMEATQGMAVHAYLHRKEGDEANAAYWYRQAHRSFPVVSLGKEWEILLDELLLASPDTQAL